MPFISDYSKIMLPAFLVLFFMPDRLIAGPYMESAHGDSSIGVNRTATSDEGYGQGNCAHCHEQHASIVGVEPVPVGGAAPYALFAQNFNLSATSQPYVEGDNFCFYCHGPLTSSGQSVQNYDYSRTFACGTMGQSDIRSTMNQLSYHNLFDVYTLAKNNFPWFTDSSNPCNACHNPHVAQAPVAADVNSSPISKPSDHFNLWRTSMGSSFSDEYEPLFCNSSHSSREPGGIPSESIARAVTPDYVGYCTDCHTSTATIYSTTLGRNLKKINWGPGGDKHGFERTDSRWPHNSNGSPVAGGGALTKAPFERASRTQDYILSCLDCHEPHGSPNVMLLRRRVNGGNLSTTIATMDEASDDGVIPNDNKDIGYLCLRCHYDDKASHEAGFDTIYAGVGENQWRHVHHRENISWDTPYCGGNNEFTSCGGDGVLRCHAWPGNGFGTPHCNDCHYHGSVVTIGVGKCASHPDSTRKTF